MLIFRCIILFWDITRVSVHALVLKTDQFSRTVQCSSTVFPLCLTCSFWSPVSVRPDLLNTRSLLIGQLTRANTAAVLNQFSVAILAAMYWLCKCVLCVMSQSHRKKRWDHWRGVSWAAFSMGERSFCWCGPLPFLTFKIFFAHKNIYKTLKENK